MFIESADNKIIKQIISLSDKKTRDELKLFVVEGKKQVCEIPKDWKIEYVVLTDKNIKIDCAKNYYITEKIFKKISDTTTPQGVLAVVQKQTYSIDNVLSAQKGVFIIIDTLQDPGNLGTIIRTAHAYNINGIFISKNSIDAFSSKVVRSTMGSIFKVPVFQECDMDLLINKFKENKIKTYALELRADKFVSDIKFENKVAIVVGNESKGISDTVLKNVDSIKIKMFTEIDSLNASVACSIAVYEISKQINC
ncbi:MAG: RNA methyltransferase [Endomicrobiaceae bacterium]|nr:RNA methyltransferase [Endomicrobiaceae bacterium]